MNGYLVVGASLATKWVLKEPYAGRPWRWQKAEKKAAGDVKAGRVKTFHSADELITDPDQK